MPGWQKPIRGAQLNRSHPLARGLVGFWPFWENTGPKVYDIAGNNDGTLTNMDPATDWVPSEMGAALELDHALDKHVDLGTFDPSPDLLTIHCRVYPTAWDGNLGGLIAKRDAWDMSQMRWQFNYYDLTSVWQFKTRDVTRSFTYATALNNWYTITLTNDPAGLCILYINGVAIGSDAGLVYASDTAARVRLGSLTGAAESWSGLIADLCVHNRILSASEAALYHAEPWAIVAERTPISIFAPLGAAHAGAAALSGVGTLTSVAAMSYAASAAVSGVGTVSAAPAVTYAASATVSGVGGLTASPGLRLPGAAALSGVGSTVANGICKYGGAAALAGQGIVTAAGRATYAAAASLSGSGTTAANAACTYGARAALSAAGTLAAVGKLTLGGAASLSGTGTVAASAICKYAAQAALSGVGTLIAVGRAIIVTVRTALLDRTQRVKFEDRTQETELLERDQRTALDDRTQKTGLLERDERVKLDDRSKQ